MNTQHEMTQLEYDLEQEIIYGELNRKAAEAFAEMKQTTPRTRPITQEELDSLPGFEWIHEFC
jgi:hypothetical protein